MALSALPCLLFTSCTKPLLLCYRLKLSGALLNQLVRCVHHNHEDGPPLIYSELKSKLCVRLTLISPDSELVANYLRRISSR